MVRSFLKHLQLLAVQEEEQWDRRMKKDATEVMLLLPHRLIARVFVLSIQERSKTVDICCRQRCPKG